MTLSRGTIRHLFVACSFTLAIAKQFVQKQPSRTVRSNVRRPAPRKDWAQLGVSPSGELAHPRRGPPHGGELRQASGAAAAGQFKSASDCNNPDSPQPISGGVAGISTCMTASSVRPASGAPIPAIPYPCRSALCTCQDERTSPSPYVLG